MDITISSISILEPGQQTTLNSEEESTNPHKDSTHAPLPPTTSFPERGYPNRIPFQPLHEGLPSMVPKTLLPQFSFGYTRASAHLTNSPFTQPARC